MAALTGIKPAPGAATVPSRDGAHRRRLMPEPSGVVRRIGSEADLRLH
jgi:hypothetical protein